MVRTLPRCERCVSLRQRQELNAGLPHPGVVRDLTTEVLVERQFPSTAPFFVFRMWSADAFTMSSGPGFSRNVSVEKRICEPGASTEEKS